MPVNYLLMPAKRDVDERLERFSNIAPRASWSWLPPSPPLLLLLLLRLPFLLFAQAHKAFAHEVQSPKPAVDSEHKALSEFRWPHGLLG